MHATNGIPYDFGHYLSKTSTMVCVCTAGLYSVHGHTHTQPRSTVNETAATTAEMEMAYAGNLLITGDGPAASRAMDVIFSNATPEERATLWQRGLCCFYAGRFLEGSEQFEIDMAANGGDVEEGRVGHERVVAVVVGHGKRVIAWVGAMFLIPGTDTFTGVNHGRIGQAGIRGR